MLCFWWSNLSLYFSSRERECGVMHWLWLEQGHVVIVPALFVTMQGCGCGGVGERGRIKKGEQGVRG